MAAIGQAQAAADLTVEIMQTARLSEGARVIVAGAGTGQMFDYISSALLRPLRLTCTDLNTDFLVRLRERLNSHSLSAFIFTDDIEHTAHSANPDFLLATLLLEHIDWRKGVDAIAALRPTCCGIIIQENPQGMATAVTPGRSLPASVAEAFKVAHPKLVPADELLRAFEMQGYRCAFIRSIEVSDDKRLVGMLVKS